MNTSALIVEMIIIGFQAIFWVAVGSAMVVGIDVQLLDSLKPVAAILAVAILPLCYAVGLIVDGFTAWLEDIVIEVLPARGPRRSKADRDQARDKRKELRQWLRLRDRALYEDMDRDAYLLRLMRSTYFITTFATLILLSMLAVAALRQASPDGALLFGGTLILIDLMSGVSWYRRRRMFTRNQDALYEQIAALRTQYGDKWPLKT